MSPHTRAPKASKQQGRVQISVRPTAITEYAYSPVQHLIPFPFILTSSAAVVQCAVQQCTYPAVHILTRLNTKPHTCTLGMQQLPVAKVAKTTQRRMHQPLSASTQHRVPFLSQPFKPASNRIFRFHNAPALLQRCGHNADHPSFHPRIQTRRTSNHLLESAQHSTQ